MYSGGPVDGAVDAGSDILGATAQLLVPVFGLLVAASGVVYWTVAAMPASDAVVAALPAALSVVAWVVVRRVAPTTAFGRRLLGWTLGGATALCGLVLLAVLAQGQSPLESFPLFQFMAGVGSLAGLLVGGNEIRRVTAAREAERARIKAELSQRELDRLEFLNHLLRHHVLNKMNVIDGYASLVHEQSEGPPKEKLATIRAETQEVTELIENVRVLVDSMAFDIDPEPVDLASVLDREVASLRESEMVTVRTDVPDDCRVLADDLLRYVFENLLRNAVEHTDAERPEVAVTATTTDDTVTVRVADDGPGIPDHRKEAVFVPEENRSRGLGLYLADTLVTEYGGDVTVEDAELGGAALVVELQRAG